jgi:hypothetical protein
MTSMFHFVTFNVARLGLRFFVTHERQRVPVVGNTGKLLSRLPDIKKGP